LSKTPGVKPAELSHRKLDKILQSHGKITKDDVLKLARENPAPKLYESVGQDLTDKQLAQKADEIAQTWGYRDYDDLLPQFQRQVDDQLEKMQTQYGDYKLPGGENYREIKMRLPHFSDEDNYKLMELEANQRRTDPAIWNTTGDAYQLKQLQAKKAAMGEPYLSSHWQGEPNVLAHMRVSDRTGPEGQKVLHVEEIQSDWHQTGRQKGYASEEKPIRMAGEVVPLDDGTYGVKWQDGSMDSLGWGKSHAERLAQQGKLTGAVPDAPFKKNWHELAMKRLLNYAADNGYDSIAITPGVEQANRYKLSSHIDNMMVSKTNQGTRQISWRPKGERVDSALQFDEHGNVVQSMLADLKGKNISNIFGKDMSEKIMQAKPYERFEGVDLDVGGEGMKGFYDQMLPSYLNQFGKKYGAEVGQVQVPVGPEPYSMGEVMSHHGMTPEQWAALDYTDRQGLEKEFSQARSTRPLHNFPITPEMREEIATKGFPLYRKGGTVNIEQEYKLKKLRK
jgi:hypothetical protein